MGVAWWSSASGSLNISLVNVNFPGPLLAHVLAGYSEQSLGQLGIIKILTDHYPLKVETWLTLS